MRENKNKFQKWKRNEQVHCFAFKQSNSSQGLRLNHVTEKLIVWTNSQLFRGKTVQFIPFLLKKPVFAITGTIKLLFLPEIPHGTNQVFDEKRDFTVKSVLESLPTSFQCFVHIYYLL